MTQSVNTNTDPDFDPLMAAAKRPAVSFKNADLNERRRLQVQSPAREAQTTDYNTGEPAYWPSSVAGERGNPKMAVVFDVFDETAGEARALWAPRPSSMLSALVNAQSSAGKRILPGGVLEVWIDSLKDTGDKKKEPQKIYKATYTPPEAPDPLTSSPASGEFGGGQAADTSPWKDTTPATEEPPF